MYVGRFAPTPSGPLHFGSIVTAIGSYCDAKFNGGRWIIRIDDLDEERNVSGADRNILHTLECLGLYWDDQPIYQSQQKSYYEDWRDVLKKNTTYIPAVAAGKRCANIPLLRVGTGFIAATVKLTSLNKSPSETTVLIYVNHAQ